MLNDDRRWKAVCERDAGFDGQFVFAVHSTGIYCRPSCPARRPNRANARFFTSGRDAESHGYRPCRRCTPQGKSPAEQMDALVEAACRLLDSPQRINLDTLSARIGLSPSHLVRAFKARTGMTPRAWAENQREMRLQAALPRASSVVEASLQSGYSGTRSVYEKADAMAPARRRRQGVGETLHYTLADCALGCILMAASERGVCALLFGDEPAPLVDDMQRRFADATLIRDDARLKPWLECVMAQLTEPNRAAHLPLDLRGTAFQLRVWQALQAIPTGETRSYARLAAEVDSHPRAVARACASNAVGLLVPCHRVVTSTGALSGYRWGVSRKAALLADERPHALPEPNSTAAPLKE